MSLLIRPLTADFTFTPVQNPAPMFAYCTLTISQQRKFSQLHNCPSQQVRWNQQLEFQLSTIQQNLWVELWVQQNNMDRKIGEGNIDLKRHYNQPGLTQSQRIDLREKDEYVGKLTITIEYKATKEKIEEMRKKRKVGYHGGERNVVIDSDANPYGRKPSIALAEPMKNLSINGFDPNIRNQKSNVPRSDEKVKVIGSDLSNNIGGGVKSYGDIMSYYENKGGNQIGSDVMPSQFVGGGVTVSTYKVFNPNSSQYNTSASSGEYGQVLAKQIEVYNQAARIQGLLEKSQYHKEMSQKNLEGVLGGLGNESGLDKSKVLHGIKKYEPNQQIQQNQQYQQLQQQQQQIQQQQLKLQQQQQKQQNLQQQQTLQKQQQQQLQFQQQQKLQQHQLQLLQQQQLQQQQLQKQQQSKLTQQNQRQKSPAPQQPQSSKIQPPQYPNQLQQSQIQPNYPLQPQYNLPQFHNPNQFQPQPQYPQLPQQHPYFNNLMYR